MDTEKDTEKEPEAFDIGTMEGLTKYVESVKEAVNQTLFQYKGLVQLGTLFAHRDVQGNDLVKPIPHVIGGLGADPKKLQNELRKGVLSMHADGVLLVHNEGRQVLFQVEHRVHGDLVWYATVGEDGLMGRLLGPQPITRFELKPLKQLPERYMS